MAPYAAPTEAPAAVRRPSIGDGAARGGASAGSHPSAGSSRPVPSSGAANRRARWNSPRSAPAARDWWTRWDSRATGPVGLLRSQLQATAASVFAQVLPASVDPSLDHSSSYPQWLGLASGRAPASDSKPLTAVPPPGPMVQLPSWPTWADAGCSRKPACCTVGFSSHRLEASQPGQHHPGTLMLLSAG